MFRKHAEAPTSNYGTKVPFPKHWGSSKKGAAWPRGDTAEFGSCRLVKLAMALLELYNILLYI